MNVGHPDMGGKAGDQVQHGSRDHHHMRIDPQRSEPLDQRLLEIEKREIIAALGRAKGQRSLAARVLGISRSRLYRRMDALGIDPANPGSRLDA